MKQGREKHFKKSFTSAEYTRGARGEQEYVSRHSFETIRFKVMRICTALDVVVVVKLISKRVNLKIDKMNENINMKEYMSSKMKMENGNCTVQNISNEFKQKSKQRS